MQTGPLPGLKWSGSGPGCVVRSLERLHVLCVLDEVNHGCFLPGIFDGCAEMISLVAVHNNEPVMEIDTSETNFQKEAVLFCEFLALQFEIFGYVIRQDRYHDSTCYVCKQR